MSNLDTIVGAHSDAVWRTVYRLVNHYDDARDCYQETFLAAVRLAGGQSSRSGLGLTWSSTGCARQAKA